MTSVPPPDPEVHDDDHHDHHDEQADHDSGHAATLTVPPFSPSALARSLWLDALLRWTVLAAVIAVLAAVSVWGAGGSSVLMLASLAAVAGWIGISVVNTKASRELPQISLLIEADPPAAEARIAENLKRRPLLRWVRLMLHHRLAVLRHHQHRYDESAAICRAVLSYPLGPGRPARPHLLLMLAEAAMESGDLHGSWTALDELYRTRLSLAEALQRVALQTRYEVLSGHDDAALHGMTQKIEMAELMPAPQCGAFHALLAVSAQRRRQHDLAAWLWARVELLCPPQQVEQMRESLK